MRILPRARRTIECSLGVALAGLALACSTQAEEAGATLSQPVLRHRVAVVAVPPAGTSTNQPNTLLLKSEAWKALLLDEALTITPDEWATAVDLTKAVVGASDTFRVVELPTRAGSGASAPGLALIARYGIGLKGKRVFFRLVEADTGTLLKSADATAAEMKTAIEDALSKIQGEADLLAWRCHVVGLNGDLMVIDRGRIDGVRDGNEFVGYSMAKAATNAPGLSDEQRIMQYGKRAGTYKVVEEGKAFSKVEPVGDAAGLKAGDILELPEIRLNDRGQKSRGKSFWNRVYEE